jgi:hypothetical protein
MLPNRFNEVVARVVSRRFECHAAKRECLFLGRMTDHHTNDGDCALHRNSHGMHIAFANDFVGRYDAEAIASGDASAIPRAHQRKLFLASNPIIHLLPHRSIMASQCCMPLACQ